MINGKISIINLIGYVTIDEYGNIAYLRDGRFHRDDGPAIIGIDGSMAWYQYGQCHRDDGPAHIGLHGYEAWYQRGVMIYDQRTHP